MRSFPRPAWAAPCRRAATCLMFLATALSPAGRAHATADGEWIPLDPPARQSFSLVYDVPRSRLVMFGGYESSQGTYNDVRSFALPGPGTWTIEHPAGAPPSARMGQATAYDSRRDRMLVFGGFSTNALSDVWALDLSGAMTWQQLTPAGAPPPAREYPSAVYDSLRDRLLIFGGAAGFGTTLNDVWELSLSGTPTWTQLMPAGTPPSPRFGATIVIDPVRDRMIVFGGEGSSGTDQRTWALDLAGSPAWTQILTSGTPPEGHYGQGGIYDPVGDRLVITPGIWMGGPRALGLGDALPTWTDLGSFSATQPPGRYQNGAVYDPVRRAFVISGGYVNASFDDTWAFSFGAASWSRLAPIGSSFPGRWSHSAVIDPRSNRVIVFGGRSPFDLSSVWSRSLVDPSGWTRLQPQGTAPAAVANVAAAYDSKRHRVLYFGGEGNQGLSNAVTALSLDGTPTWGTLLTAGTPPSPRVGATAIYDPQGDRLVVFGGLFTSPYSDVSNEVWSLTLSGTPTWSLLLSGTGPDGRAWATSTYDASRHRMLLFGGFSYGYPGVYNDVWGLALAPSPAWVLLAPPGAEPAARYTAEAVLDRARDRLVIHGGGYADVWALSLSGVRQWTRLMPPPPGPEARNGSQGLYDVIGDRLLAIGGRDGNYNYEGDTWALDFGAATRPEIECPGPTTWTPGASHTLDLRLTSRLGAPELYRWRVSCDRAWPGLPDSAGLRVDPGATVDLPVTFTVPDTVVNGPVTIRIVTWLDGVPHLADTCEVELIDLVTPTLVAAAETEITDAGVRLAWRVAPGVIAGEVYRRSEGADWSWIAPATRDGRDRLAFEDRDVLPGRTYAYKLRIADGSLAAWSPEVLVRVPGAELAIRGSVPSPARGSWSIELRLPANGPVSLRMLDASGRRVREVEVSGTAGTNRIPLGNAGLEPGVYWVQARQAGRSVTSRIVVLE